MIHFSCPRCDNRVTKIISTTINDADFKRKRSCHKCGNTFVTYEIVAKEWKLLKEFIKLLKRHQ